MGYFVKIIECNFFLKKENYDSAYKAMCELNSSVNDAIKQGGSWGGSPKQKPNDSLSLSNSPYKWFSWMPWNYDETCETITEILDELGFFYCDDKEGITHLGYDNKTGQEDLFFEAIAQFVEDGSYIVWQGEDGTMYVWEFSNGTMQVKEARITW